MNALSSISSKDWMEGQLMDLIDWEQRMADMAEQRRLRKKEVDDIRREVYYGDDRNYEQEDLQLAQDLRNLAERIERRYK